MKNHWYNEGKQILIKEDKMDKFMDKFLSEVVSKFSINFLGGLKAY